MQQPQKPQPKPREKLRWRYHETLAPEGKIFTFEESDKKIKEGWVDSPALFGKIPLVAKLEEETPELKTKRRGKA